MELNAFKYRPAEAHQMALQRAYLRNFFAASFDLPLVILEADSGYGKTTTLSIVAQREGSSARWLTLDESDCDPATLIRNILQSIYEIDLPADTLSTSRAVTLIVGALRELSIGSLILDNYDLVARLPHATELLEQLLRELPEFTRLIVATRLPIPLRQSRWLRGHSAILTQMDLAFDVEDVSQYFRVVHNYGLTREEASFITQQTGGKPLVINLLGQLARGLPSYLKVDWSALPLASEREVVKLMLREVFSKIPRSISSAIHNLEEGRDGLPRDGTDSLSALLDLMAKRHCLVQSYPAGNSSVNVPHETLFRVLAEI